MLSYMGRQFRKRMHKSMNLKSCWLYYFKTSWFCTGQATFPFPGSHCRNVAEGFGRRSPLWFCCCCCFIAESFGVKVVIRHFKHLLLGPHGCLHNGGSCEPCYHGYSRCESLARSWPVVTLTLRILCLQHVLATGHIETSLDLFYSLGKWNLFLLEK